MNRGAPLASQGNPSTGSQQPPGYRAQKIPTMNRVLQGNLQNGPSLTQPPMRYIPPVQNVMATQGQQHQQTAPHAQAISPGRGAPKHVDQRQVGSLANSTNQQALPRPPVAVSRAGQPPAGLIPAAPRGNPQNIPYGQPPMVPQASPAGPPQPHPKQPPAPRVSSGVVRPSPAPTAAPVFSHQSAVRVAPPGSPKTPPRPAPIKVPLPTQSSPPVVAPQPQHQHPQPLPQIQPEEHHSLPGSQELEAAMLDFDSSSLAPILAPPIPAPSEAPVVPPQAPQPPQHTTQQPQQPPSAAESNAVVFKRLLDGERKQNEVAMQEIIHLRADIEQFKSEISKLKEQQLFEAHARQLDDDAMDIAQVSAPLSDTTNKQPPVSSPSQSAAAKSVTHIGHIQVAIPRGNSQTTKGPHKRIPKGAAKPSLQTIIVGASVAEPNSSRIKRKRTTDAETVLEETSLGDDDWVEDATSAAPQNENSQQADDSVDYRRRCQEYYLQLTAVRKALRSAPSGAASIRHLEESVVHGVAERLGKSFETLGDKLSQQIIEALDSSKKRKTTPTTEQQQANDAPHHIDALRMENDVAQTRIRELDNKNKELQQAMALTQSEAQKVVAEAENKWKQTEEQMLRQFETQLQQLQQKHESELITTKERMQQEHDAAVAQLRQDNTQLAQALQQIHAESAAELRAANEKIQAVLTNCEGHVREAEEKERSLSVSICAAEDQKKRYENQLAQMELLSAEKDAWIEKIEAAFASAHAEKERLAEEVQALKRMPSDTQNRSGSSTATSNNASKGDQVEQDEFVMSDQETY